METERIERRSGGREEVEGEESIGKVREGGEERSIGKGEEGERRGKERGRS